MAQVTMPKSKRGRKMPAWRKWVRVGFGIFGKFIGGLVVASPSFRGLQLMAGGNLLGGTDALAYDYVGFIPSSGTFDGRKAFTGIGTVLAGVVLLALFSAVAKRF